MTYRQKVYNGKLPKIGTQIKFMGFAPYKKGNYIVIGAKRWNPRKDPTYPMGGARVRIVSMDDYPITDIDLYSFDVSISLFNQCQKKK